MWNLRQVLDRPINNLPLVILRVAFGLLMFFSTARFISMGWIDDFYVQPEFHFTYLGFGWVQPLPEVEMYAVFGSLLILSILIALGAAYRVSIIAFFLLFTYVELIDKTYYLNHYYFISVISLLMIALPLNRRWSVDAWLNPNLRTHFAPAWTLYAPRLLVGIVYVYAGIAKLQPDWMLDALPLRIWLPAKADTPLIGRFFDYLWVAYLMSWTGALYDLTIPFWLTWRRTRFFAYFAVIAFHLMTAALFNIGVFPFVMIALTLIFFNADDWHILARRIRLNVTLPSMHSKKFLTPVWLLLLMGLFFVWQLLMPLRHWLYPGNHLWTEEGYRFAWHVVLVEKNGSATFRVEDQNSDAFWVVHPRDYLTAQQEKQMSFQPDMIVQFAHYLAEEVKITCQCEPRVFVEAYVSLNGRSSRLIIDPVYDLTDVSLSLQSDEWIFYLEE